MYAGSSSKPKKASGTPKEARQSSMKGAKAQP
jgi:hypothetical protein